MDYAVAGIHAEAVSEWNEQMFALIASLFLDHFQSLSASHTTWASIQKRSQGLLDDVHNRFCKSSTFTRARDFSSKLACMRSVDVINRITLELNFTELMHSIRATPL